MSHLLRSHAPLTDDGWAALDAEATPRLQASLAARRMVDFSGPKGWQYFATNLGRVKKLASLPGESGQAGSGLVARQRKVLPLVELRADFEVSRGELADLERGAEDIDLDGLDAAVQSIAVAENAAVFHGFPAAGIVGIAEGAPHPQMALGDDCDLYPSQVARAVAIMRGAGVGGPYGLAVGPEVFTRIVETAEHGGYLLLDHLGRILDGPVVWAPGVQGAIVCSLRGGDFLFESGQDLALGYDWHDAETVHLYVEESFSFRVATPEAAVALA